MSQVMEGHTHRRYDGELNALHLLVLEMGGLVLEQVRQSLHALLKKDLTAAHQVLELENQVDALELRADNEVVKVIARRGPIALDLRVIMAFSKAITDMERIGDEAARIAYITLEMYSNERRKPKKKLLRDINTFGNMAVSMLQDALGSLDELDLERALGLLQGQNELDAEFQSSLRHLATFILEDARNLGHTINVTLAIKSFERIGDHARNLAEYIVYMLHGEDVRHQKSKEELKRRNLD